MKKLFLAGLLIAVFAIPAHALDVGAGWVVSPITDVTVTGTATLIRAAASNRTTLSCTNTSASVNVRWGDSTVTASKGQRVPFGSAIEIRNTGAVYMISEGASVTVSCTEETR